jgi:uncharacterized membrane protein (Fun14 family)
MSINESFVLSATAMGGGDFFVAVLIEYALKKVIKILAVIVGYFHLHEHIYNNFKFNDTYSGYRQY